MKYNYAFISIAFLMISNISFAGNASLKASVKGSIVTSPGKINNLKWIGSMAVSADSSYAKKQMRHFREKKLKDIKYKKKVFNKISTKNNYSIKSRYRKNVKLAKKETIKLLSDSEVQKKDNLTEKFIFRDITIRNKNLMDNNNLIKRQTEIEKLRHAALK